MLILDWTFFISALLNLRVIMFGLPFIHLHWMIPFNLEGQGRLQ